MNRLKRLGFDSRPLVRFRSTGAKVAAQVTLSGLCFAAPLLLLYASSRIPWVVNTLQQLPDAPRRQALGIVTDVLIALSFLLCCIVTSRLFGLPAATIKAFRLPKAAQYLAVGFAFGVLFSPAGIATVLTFHSIPDYFQAASVAAGRFPWLLTSLDLLLVALYEEGFFRAFLLPVLAQKFRPLTAIILSALLFGGLHCIGDRFDWSDLIFNTLDIACRSGLLYAALFWWKRSIWLPAGLHFGLDLAGTFSVRNSGITPSDHMSQPERYAFGLHILMADGVYFLLSLVVLWVAIKSKKGASTEAASESIPVLVDNNVAAST